MKIGKVEKLLAELYDKKFVIHIRNLKQALIKAIKFNQEAWLKAYIDINTELRKKLKNDFKKGLFKLMNNTVFGKTMQNIRNHGDIKLAATEARRNYFLSEPNYHQYIYFLETLLTIEKKKHKYSGVNQSI